MSIQTKKTDRTDNEYLTIPTTGEARYVMECDDDVGDADNNVIAYINTDDTSDTIQSWRCKIEWDGDLWEKNTIQQCPNNTCAENRKKGCFKNNKLLCICAPQGRNLLSVGKFTLISEGGETAESGCFFKIPPEPPLPTKAEEVNKYDVKYYYPTYSILRHDGTRAWRNNNPGNMRAGVSDYLPIGKAGNFAVFADQRIGRAALFALLKTENYQKLTLEQVIHKYAPPVENNTSKYVTFAVKGTGKSKDTPLSSFDAEDLEALVNTISIHEGWREGTETKI